MSENNRVLILYAKSDGQAAALGIKRRLHRDLPQIEVQLEDIPAHPGWWHELAQAIYTVDFILVVLTPDAPHDALLRAKWRHAQQTGKCVLPIVTAADLELAHLPSWKRTRPFYELALDWHRLVEMIRGIPCQTPRIPFMPPNMPHYYVRRDHLYETLVRMMLDPDRSKPVVITSQQSDIGGFGKTTLATALCHDTRIQDAFPDGILWVDLGETPDIMEELGNIYAALTGEDPGFVDMDNAIDQVVRVLSDKDCLMVLDGISTGGHLRPFLRGGKRCLRLVTLRDFNLVQEGRRVNVDMMTMGEAHEMFTLHFDGAAPDRSYYLHELLKQLGYWPLAVELAARAVRWQVKQRGLTLAQALQGYVHYLTQNPALQNSQADLLSAVIQYNLDLLGDERPLSLQLGIFPSSTDVDLSVLAALWTQTFLETVERVRRLDALGIVYFLERHGQIRIHAMIRDYLGTQISDASALHAALIDAWGDPLKLWDNYAWHWYVYHLIEAEQFKKLEALLTNFHWLQAKLEALNISEVITDFHRVQRIVDDEALTKLSLHRVEGALQLSARVLAQDNQQLAAQLLGRLMSQDDPLIKKMVEQAEQWSSELWLRPLAPSLTAPGGVVLRSFQHTHGITTAVVTPDGQHLVTGTVNGAVMLWDMAAGELLQLLGRHEARVNSLQIMDTWIISASVDHKITAWSLTGSPPRYFSGHQGPVTSLALLPENERFISVSWDGTLKIWHFNDSQPERTLVLPESWAGTVAVTPDGKKAITTTQSHLLHVWDLDTESIQYTLTGHHDIVRVAAVTPDGRWLISGSDDGTLMIWDLQSGLVEDVLTGHTLGITSLTITPDGLYAVSGSKDNSLKIWELVRGIEKHTLIGHEFSVSGAALTPDGQQVVSASLDGSVIIWDLKQDAVLDYRHKREVLALDFNKDRIVSGAGCGSIKIWDTTFQTPPLSLDDAHTHAITALVLTPDGRRLASGDRAGILKIWSLETGRVEHLLQDDTARAVTALALTPDGQTLISGSTDGQIGLWALSTGTPIRTLNGHHGAVRTLWVQDDLLISGAGDHTITLWNIRDGSLLHTLKGHTNWITTLLFENGQVISGGGDGWVMIWDAATGKKLHGWHAHYDWILALASVEGQIISGAADGTLRVWNAETGAFIHSLHGHTEGIRTLNRLNSRLVSASADAT
ncbi:MAG: TIR domain-containing protein, partial [Anaerolineae bacterium]|nr:TIR domain-containing protein [Anaerolineae bacterium]